MRKIPLSDGSGRWFDIDETKKFQGDSYYDNNGNAVCKATGRPDFWEVLHMTLGGHFILVRDEPPNEIYATEVDENAALRWLISNGHQDEAKKLDLAKEEARLRIP